MNILDEALKVAKIFNLTIFQCEIISYHKLFVDITFFNPTSSQVQFTWLAFLIETLLAIEN